MLKSIIQEEALQAYEMQKVREEFCPEGQLAEFSYSSDKDVVNALVAKANMLIICLKKGSIR